MAHSLPRIQIPEASGITVDPDACAAFMRGYGVPDEHMPFVTIHAYPGTPKDKILLPAHLYQAELMPPLYMSHDIYGRHQTLVLYPDNIRSELHTDPIAPSRHVAEGLSLAVDYATLGMDGINRVRQAISRRAYFKGIVKPSLGTAALAGGEGAAIYLNDKMDLQLPWPLAIVGLGVFAVMIAETHLMGKEAKVRLAQEKNASRAWPEQLRARERAKVYTQQVEAGEKPPLATVNRTL